MNKLPLSIKPTPMMEQWHRCKNKAKDALVLFRLGDFYEAFYEDAHILTKELELTLTQRQKIPMCGVPYHTCDSYVDRLIAKGYKVAIAEQVEDAKSSKGLVKREIIRIISPATIVHSNLLSEKSNNFFVSISLVGKIYGISIIDLTTAEFKVMEIENEKQLMDELFRLKPKELLISKKLKQQKAFIFEELSYGFHFILNTRDEWYFDHRLASQSLLDHFNLHSLDCFGVQGFIPSINAAGALITYLQDDLQQNLKHIKTLQKDSLSSYMSLDSICIKNLELFESTSSKEHTLLTLLDKTKTPMGGRLLSSWIKHPLLCPKNISKRQKAIEELLSQTTKTQELSSLLSHIKDFERLIMKISTNYASPKDFIGLKQSLAYLPHVKNLITTFDCDLLTSIEKEIKNLDDPYQLIDQALVENPPLRVTDGETFKMGYNKDLDDLRLLRRNSKTWLANYQTQLKDQTGIKNLRVGFTRVFGYYIEVSRGQTNKIPSYFIRKQTLANAERFFTEELKDFEHKILTAEERIKAIETELFTQLKKQILPFLEDIHTTSKAIAHLDALLSLSFCAQEYNYTCPIVDTSDNIIIKKGRHPIIEQSIYQHEFIPNDTHLDDKNRLFLITGPNMAGKSTYIRQVALIVILAQMGSFVPASFAHIGIIDKVFSRIGASDDISRGRSTFMVEMSETANILNNVTSRSLVILDEIGRGTSTYDGISIAWSVAEFLLTEENKKAKTLFATHYWELTEMEKKIPGAVNYNVAVEETDQNVIFLRKIILGGTDKSYGIHVAKLAGLPTSVLKKAKLMLKQLENPDKKKKKKTISTDQFSFFDFSNQTSKIEKEIKELNIEKITPMEALKILFSLQEKVNNK